MSPLAGVPSKMGACFELSELEMFAYRTHRMRVSRSMLLISTLRDRPLRETRKSDRKVRLPWDSRAWSVKADIRHNNITDGALERISAIFAESLFSKESIQKALIYLSQTRMKPASAYSVLCLLRLFKAVQPVCLKEVDQEDDSTDRPGDRVCGKHRLDPRQEMRD